MPALPTLTSEQRAEALEKSRRSRAARSDLKARLKKGTVTLADVIRDADTDDVIAKTKVADLLTSLPGVGPVRARQLMERHGIAENRKVRGLGPNQRAALAEEFAA